MTVEKPLLIDTNVLVDFLRGKNAAVDYVSRLDRQPAISALTVAEVFAGVKGEKEIIVVGDFIDSCRIVPVDAGIARRGGLYRNEYFKSRGVGLADGIIAATAVEMGATLVTLNRKHFPMLSALLVPYG